MAQANRNNKKRGLSIPPIWILGIASGLSPFGMIIVVPALNSIANRFDASLGQVQFVVSIYLLGLAIAQPVCGFLCDRFGRRPVMLCGFGLFVLASLLCAFASTLDQLIVMRLLQGIGVSVGTVASRATLRDAYDPNRMAEAMSSIAAAMGIAPVIAPLVGGMIDASMSYSAIFGVTSAIGVLIFISMFFNLSETLPADFARPRVREWLASYRILLGSNTFVGNTLVFGFVQGSFFAFIAIGTSLLLSKFAIGSAEFGFLWGMMALGYVFGAIAAARLTPRYGSQRVMQWCVIMGALSGIAVIVCASYGPLTTAKVLLPLAAMMMFAGGSTPAAIAAAVADHPKRAGTAAGLSSSLALVVSGAFTIASGVVYQGDYFPIAVIICLSGILMLVAWKFSQRAS